MISHVIPLISSFLSPLFLEAWFYPLIGLAFLATFPYIIRAFFRRK